MFFQENGQYRCAVYLRLSRSDGDQQESNSIKNQRALLNDYLGKHPELHKVDEYVDDGYSGTNFERPDFKRMMQDIENRKINCIIVKDLSRFGRNYIETGRYLERIFPFMGVRFIAINDHYDSAEDNDDKGRILIPFNNLINDTYCRDISMRVRSHLDVKRKEGQFIGSFAGYGYQKDPKDKNHLIIDEYAAGIVQEIFKQKLNGMSSQRIASYLNKLGVLPPNEYKRANGFNYTCGFQAGLNQKWTVVSVNRILKNESYTGTLIQGKRRKINYKVKKSHDVGSENWIRVEDAHDAIISKGEFRQVQQLLELDTRTAPSQTTVYPLSGFLRCADCGQNMIRRTVTKNGKKYQYYHCSTYKNGGGCTPHEIVAHLMAKDDERTAVYREYEQGSISLEQVEEYEHQYQVAVQKQEAAFKKVMLAVNDIEKAFSHGNPWLMKFRAISIPEKLERTHLKEWLDHVWIVDFEQVEVILQESEWKRFFPEEWLNNGEEDCNGKKE